MPSVAQLSTVLIPLASVFLWHYSDLKVLLCYRFIACDPDIEVLIGVLSSRQNFKQRQALRETWVGFARHHKHLLVKFIVGDGVCTIPPEYRQSSYSCIPNNLTFEDSDVTAIDTSTASRKETVPVSLPSKISFRVHYPIVIQRLGLYWEEESLLRSTYSVTLFDEINQVDVAHVDISQMSKGHRVDSYLFKPIESFVLPEDFEGSIVVTSSDPQDEWITVPEGPAAIATGGNVISYFQNTWTDPVADGLPFHGEGALMDAAGNFMFVIHEPEELEKLIAEADGRTEEWRAEMLRVEEKLGEEMRMNGDIVLVGAVDTYRNIPLKMKLFHKWMSKNMNFKYFLKTDDDCFLNPQLIIEQLRTDVLPLGEKVWWGNFRYNWGVDRHGKWAEVDYPSTAYPAFACGSGNLVSADIVHWIARNSQYLHLYQGEDVTMAIWMSSILPSYIDDKRWICDERCTPSELASAEHTPENLRHLWNNWNACGNPCGCDYEPPRTV